ncbi:MAG TPA: HipA family kinase [Candidatus Acidoferrales bacterium]|nr:HipA family kinase [Candidatus Acidoferrales bacterium]
MKQALERIRRMRGGAQSHLMRCEDGSYYIVKFQNNPQGVRILANELLATRLAARLGLPAAPPEVIDVPEELIANTEDLVMQLGRGRAACRAGRQFGSRYPGSPAETAVYDFLPETALEEVENLRDFAGMLAFDKWTCNTNGRQAIFFRPAGDARYRAQMIDNGFCFNAGEWNFPDAPLRGIYLRHRVYAGVTGIDSFEPWLSRIESRVGEAALDEIQSEIPPEWYDDDADALNNLLERLWKRRSLARELVIAAWKSSAQPFPNWK